MPDPRFFDTSDPLSTGDLARLTGAILGQSSATDLKIVGVAPLDRAGPADVAFLGDKKHVAALRETRAGACFVHAAQAAEHYEITRYGSLIAWAKQLGRNDCASVLQKTLDEEKATDQKLTKLAESKVNLRAAS